MNWVCFVCLEELPPTWVQQGGAHMGCFEEWYEKEIPVWEIEVDGASYIEGTLANIQDLLENMDDDSYYKITKTTMKQGKYKSLPEFTGF